ncbi:MAG: sulfotransferase [Salinibacter sp.]
MTFDDRYGWLDRLLHRTAFRAGTAQHAMADVEEMLFEETLADVSVDRPVFITALPRSGTTILLRLLWDTGHFASHTYQDMPFVLCPLLWNQYTGQFAGEATTRERAHGDGLEVSETSPEAFEEMIWKHFWSGHYKPDRIHPWTEDDRDAAFNAFFNTHLRKIVAVRQETAPGRQRYLSKNNLNIARLAAPPAPMRDGTFLIPFRKPVQQAASMLRQHERFLEIHEDDDFVREYMEAIGHHEFGKGLKPVNFDDWLADAPSPDGLDFWVRYWIAAYRHVLRHAGDNTHLVSYAQLTEDPEPALARLAQVVDAPEADLLNQTDRLEPPRTHSVDESKLSNSLRRTADELHDRLRQRAGVASLPS